MALLLIILGPILITLQWLSILFRKSSRPVPGRALQPALNKQTNQQGMNPLYDSNEAVSRPSLPPSSSTTTDDAFVAIACKGFVRVDLNSTRNKYIAPFTLFLIIYIVCGTGAGIGMNTFSTAQVTLDTQLALIGMGRPDGDITAGILGLTGLNVFEGSSSYNDWCPFLTGTDERSCMIVAVAGGFTILYATVIFSSGVAAIVWASLIYYRRRRLSRSNGLGYVVPPLTFPSRLYTLISLAGSSLGGIMFVWGLPTKFALATGALVPSANFVTGMSWYIIVLTKIHVAILEFIVWHIIESATHESSSQVIHSEEKPFGLYQKQDQMIHIAGRV